MKLKTLNIVHSRTTDQFQYCSIYARGPCDREVHVTQSCMHIFFPAKGLRLIALEQHVFVAVKISYINPRLYMLQSRMSGTRRSRMTNEQLRKSSRQQQPTGRPRPSGRRRHAPDELKQNRNIRGLSTLPISRRRYRLEPSPIAIGVTRNRPLKRRLCHCVPHALECCKLRVA